MPTVIISNNTTGAYPGDFSGANDTEIKQSTPTTNMSGNSHYEIHKFGAGDHAHATIVFTGLSNIPSAATITSVTLGLYLVNASAGADHDFTLRRILRNWVLAEATWNVWSTGNSWTTAGAQSDGNDRVAASSGTFGPVNITTGAHKSTTWSSGGVVDDVQGWVAGSFSNYGWLIERSGAGEDSTFRDFSDSAAATDGNRPYLSVTYTVGAPPSITWVGYIG